MADAPLRSNALIVDAADSERLAAFRSEPLGRPAGGRTGPCVRPPPHPGPFGAGDTGPGGGATA